MLVPFTSHILPRHPPFVQCVSNMLKQWHLSIARSYIHSLPSSSFRNSTRISIWNTFSKIDYVTSMWFVNIDIHRQYKLNLKTPTLCPSQNKRISSLTSSFCSERHHYYYSIWRTELCWIRSSELFCLIVWRPPSERCLVPWTLMKSTWITCGLRFRDTLSLIPCAVCSLS